MSRNGFIILITFILAFGSFGLFAYYSDEQQVVMNGFQDCSWVHTIPGPTNCADNNLMATVNTLELKSFVFLIIGLAFILGLAIVPIIIERRVQESVADVSDSIKVVDLT